MKCRKKPLSTNPDTKLRRFAMIICLQFVALFLFADRLTAQHSVQNPAGQRLHRLEYENNAGETAVTTFFYDENGLMYEAFWECTDGSDRSNNYYRYDDAGRMISAYREFASGVTSYEIFLYDDAGRKVHETFLRSDGVTGTADYRYLKDGSCERVICDKYKGWISGDIVYKRDKKNKRAVSAEIVRNGATAGTIDFEYDKKGSLIRDTWLFVDGFTQTFIYRYEEIEK